MKKKENALLLPELILKNKNKKHFWHTNKENYYIGYVVSHMTLALYHLKTVYSELVNIPHDTWI